MTAHGAGRGYVMIWIGLLGMTLFCVTLSLVFGPRPVVVLTFFAIASAKSLLVALNYMHLKLESRLIYAIVIVPVLFVLGLTVALFPDFVLPR